MKIFDIHCDTAYEMYKQNSCFDNDLCHVTKKKAHDFEKYFQVFAVWSEYGLSDNEAYKQFFAVRDHFVKSIDRELVTTREKLENAEKNKSFGAILGVEGANLLGGDLNRLDKIFEQGVRVLTLAWQDDTCIGGAHNTSSGLTDFGKAVTERCFELGIIPDVSHLSDEGFSDVFDISCRVKKPFIASHSLPRALCDVKRNLTDEQFVKIASSGGIVGVNLVGSFVLKDYDEENGRVHTVKDVVERIKYLKSLENGENALCLGFDFDGTDKLPAGISSLSDVPKIYEAVAEEISEDFAQKLFFKNAYGFFVNNLPRV